MACEILKLPDHLYHARQEVAQSGLITFIKEPKMYEYVNILGNYNNSNDTKATGLGSATHKYYLEESEFWNTYYLAEFTPPANKQQQDFANAVFDREFPRDIETAYSTFYSIKGKSLGAIKASAKELYESIKGYGEYIKFHSEKQLLEKKVYLEVQELFNHAIYHPEASEYLFAKDKEYIYENEFALLWKSPDSDLPLRCKIDRLRIDLDNRKAVVVDYKTSMAVSIRQFVSSIRKYWYHIQDSFYTTAIKVYLLEKYGVEFDVEFLFLPQNTTVHKKMLGVVELSKKDKQLAYDTWTKALFDLETCMYKNDFEMYPQECNGRYVVKAFDESYTKVEEIVKAITSPDF